MTKGIFKKLNNQQVEEIKSLYQKGKVGYYSLSKKYNVCPASIRNIVDPELRAKQKRYFDNNKGMYRQKHKEYYLKNSEVIKKRSRDYFYAHRSHYNKMSKEWYYKNKLKNK